MADKEYSVDDLAEKARLAWILDDDPEPDVRVFVKDGKAGVFISTTSGWQGMSTRRCISLGEPFSYDEAFVLEFDMRWVTCIPAFSCFLALGKKGRTTIYAVEGYQATPIIEDAPSMQEAKDRFGERIGLKFAPWKDIFALPTPTWD